MGTWATWRALNKKKSWQIAVCYDDPALNYNIPSFDPIDYQPKRMLPAIMSGLNNQPPPTGTLSRRSMKLNTEDGFGGERSLDPSVRSQQLQSPLPLSNRSSASWNIGVPQTSNWTTSGHQSPSLDVFGNNGSLMHQHKTAADLLADCRLPESSLWKIPNRERKNRPSLIRNTVYHKYHKLLSLRPTTYVQSSGGSSSVFPPSDLLSNYSIYHGSNFYFIAIENNQRTLFNSYWWTSSYYYINKLFQSIFRFPIPHSYLHLSSNLLVIC